MISRQHRFHGRGALHAVYQKGATARSDHATLRVVPSRRPDYRLAVVVSRKVSKSAVVRNRIRRRAYEIVRLARAEANEPWPYDMILTVFDDQLATMPAAVIQRTIVGLLKKAKLSKA